MDQTFKPTGLPMMRRLHFLAIRCIFDRKNFSKLEGYELEMGIEKYMRIIDALTPLDREDLHRIVDCLLADEELDYFHKQKFMIKQHNLNVYTLYRAGLPCLNVYRPLTGPNEPLQEPKPGVAT